MKQLKQMTACLDEERINVYEKFELNQWSQVLGVTQQDLMTALAAAGTEVERVKEFLRIHHLN